MGDRQTAIQFSEQAMRAIQDPSHTVNAQMADNLFNSACVADPTYGHAFYQAGNNNADRKWAHSAVALYRRAAETEMAPPDRARVLCNLSWQLHAVGQTHEALSYAKKSLELDPSLAYSWVNLSCIHQILDDSNAAVKAATTAFALSPEDATVEMALAFALLFDRQFHRGFQHYESRFRYRLHQFLQYPYPKWEGEDVADKTIFLVSDQGLGDTLRFSRFLRKLAGRARFIHAYIQPELMRAFAHAFVDLPNLNLLPSGSPFPQADYWTTFASLPFGLKLDDDEVRFRTGIELPAFSIPSQWKTTDRKLHVGIAWAGSPLNDIDRHRNIPLHHFAELYRVPGIQLYGLQVGDRRRDIYENGYPVLVRDLSPYITDVCDTVSLIKDLDLVICCESALAHISGTVGKETWIPYSFLGRDFGAGLTGKDALWYRKHRFFRQRADLDWKPVFQEIEHALREKLGGLAKAS